MTKKSNPSLFNNSNYVWLFSGLGIIVTGLLLMSGGGSDDPSKFDPSIYNFRRLTIAPLILIAGYALIIYAIMKPESQKGK